MDNNNKQLQNNGSDGENEKTLSIRDLIFMVLNNWWWFVISVVVCMIIAAFLYKAQAKTWTASGTILVRDEGNNVRYQSRNMDQILSNMGMDNTNLSLENEIYMLKSSWLMNQVVNRLGLNHTCSRNDLFKKISYFKDAPLTLTVHDSGQENRDVELHVKVKALANNKYEYRATKFGQTVEAEAYYSQPVKFDDTVSFTIEKTQFYNKDYEDVTLNMSVLPSMKLARNMLKSITISRVDKMASIISITYNDSNRERANQIVDTLIAVYNDDAIEDKNKVAQKTESFISERIALISGELDVVDAQVENIKRTSGLGEMTGANTQLLQTGQRLSEQVVALETEMTLISYIKNYVSDPVNKEELIPVNVGISDVGIQGMINSYNSLVVRYKRLKTTAGPNNPEVQGLKRQMDDELSAINASISNLINATRVRLQDARGQEAKARGQIAAMPTQTKAVTEVTRQQKIKEELYLYLLSKREETAMNLAVTVSNAKVVEPAIVNLTGPRLVMFALVALVLGLALPALIMFCISFFDTKLRSKVDVERNTSLPILGEIPQKPAARVNDEIIVTANGTDVVTEAFRLLHSNIPFFLKDGQKVIQTVSTVPGEGKSYTALNLALSLAYVGKKTILIDFDLRKRSLSKTIDRHNRVGLIHYLLDQEDNFEKYIMHSETSDHLDYVVCEKTPPNATQLLMGEKLDRLVNYLRKHYDYIIFDSTPAQIVADASVINRVADLTTYIMRVGYLNKNSLPFIQEMADKGKFKNMAVILTDVPLIKKRYGGYGYGYGYGYGEESDATKEK